MTTVKTDLYESGRRLASEVQGLLYAYEDAIRDVVGHANFNIYAQRLAEFETALAKARGDAPSSKGLMDG